MQRLGKGTRIDEFCGIEPCCGRGGNVANIVHTGAARGQPKGLQPGQHVDYIARLNLANLDIRTGRDIGVAAAKILRQISQAIKLRARQLSGWYATAQHERVLRRSYVKKSMIPKPECVGLVREFVFFSVRQKLIPDFEWVFFEFPLLLFAQVSDRSAEHSFLLLVGTDRWAIL